MAAQDFDATMTPVDVVAALNLNTGIAYSVQNVGTGPTLFIRDSATAPSPGDRAFRVEAGGAFSIRPEANIPIYLWTDDTEGCPVIITEHV